MAETKEQILKNIRENYNYYTAFEVKQFLLDDKIISESELLRAVENDMEIVEAIKAYYNPVLEYVADDAPTKIKDYCTEIYFWGLPSAGKTWALSGIVNTISKDNYKSLGLDSKDEPKCVSSNYLNGLLTVIDNKKAINYLPNKTSNDTIRYMNFILLKGTEERKVAFIDLSGELVKAIANENVIKNHKDLQKERELLKNLLNSKNQKIHFFFIDYERKDKADDRQNIHFANLCAVFNSKKYFDTQTDFIYFVITKADAIDDRAGNQRKNAAIKFFKENYGSFRNNMGKICKENEINFGDEWEEDNFDFLDEFTLDFSMGEVLFLRMCRFDKKSSQEIVNILLTRVQKERSGRWAIFG